MFRRKKRKIGPHFINIRIRKSFLMPSFIWVHWIMFNSILLLREKSQSINRNSTNETSKFYFIVMWRERKKNITNQIAVKSVCHLGCQTVYSLFFFCIFFCYWLLWFGREIISNGDCNWEIAELSKKTQRKRHTKCPSGVLCIYLCVHIETYTHTVCDTLGMQYKCN